MNYLSKIQHKKSPNLSKLIWKIDNENISCLLLNLAKDLEEYSILKKK